MVLLGGKGHRRFKCSGGWVGLRQGEKRSGTGESKEKSQNGESHTPTSFYDTLLLTRTKPVLDIVLPLSAFLVFVSLSANAAPKWVGSWAASQQLPEPQNS